MTTTTTQLADLFHGLESYDRYFDNPTRLVQCLRDIIKASQDLDVGICPECRGSSMLLDGSECLTCIDTYGVISI